MTPLPIDAHREELVGLLAQERRLVLVAEPGAGKTTRFPASFALDGILTGRTWVVEPRRIAAVAAAARVADERGLHLGHEVGYSIRLERRTEASTRLEFLTAGLALRRLQEDPFLEGVSCVVLDEFHERSLELDLLLAFLADVRRQCRPDLAVAVLSATLEPVAVARFLDEAPVRHVPGRAFPVEVRHETQVDDRPIAERCARAIAAELPRLDGALLCFLPGIEAIRSVRRGLEEAAAACSVRLLDLHGSSSLEEQRAALDPRAGSRVLLATNVAETSITVPDVRVVVDSGLERSVVHDPGRGVDRLETVPISRHSAEQRAGRAGRVAPGRAIRLWTAVEHARRPAAREAEILRADLVPLVLELKAWGVSRLGDLPLFESAPEAALTAALRRAVQLGALEAEDRPLTPLGRELLEMPLAPRLGRLVLAAAAEGEHVAGCRLAALIEEREILADPVAAAKDVHRSCDLLDRLHRFERARAERFSSAALHREGLRAGAARKVDELARDLERRTRRGEREADRGRAGSRDERLRRALLAAFADRVVARRPDDPRRGRMVGGRGVALARTSAVLDGALFLALALQDGERGRRTESTVTMASAIERAELEALHPGRLGEVVELRYDERLGRVRALATRCYEDLPLESPREVRADPERARALLEEELHRRLPAALEADEASQRLLARLRFARQHAAELPEFSLATLAEQLAAPLSPDDRLSRLLDSGLAQRLRDLLPYALRSALARLAPEHVELPNGRKAPLRYGGEGPPVLEARVQELFGLTTTPRVAEGRVPVLLHVLGPNRRPVQVTQDLESFWRSTYPQVRKDLRARYPKHAWPEDPLAGVS